MSAPEKSDPFEVFMSALVGADRVVVQTRNALGENDAHYFPAPELLDAINTRADLCDPLQDERVKALVEAIEEHATHRLNGKPYNPAMRKVFAARAALKEGAQHE
jgi:hypothetical protein